MPTFDFVVGEKVQEVELLSVSKTGSRLYGTDTDRSDADFAIVYAPMRDDALLGDWPDDYRHNTGVKSEKNNNRDIDYNFWSLRNFLYRCAECEPQAMELMFADDSTFEFMSPYMRKIRERSDEFLSENLGQMLRPMASVARMYIHNAGILKRTKALNVYLQRYRDDEMIEGISGDLVREFPDLVKYNPASPSTGGVPYLVIGIQHINTNQKLDQLHQALRGTIRRMGKVEVLDESDISYGRVAHAMRVGYQLRRALQGKPMLHRGDNCEEARAEIKLVSQIKCQHRKWFGDIQEMFVALYSELQAELEKIEPKETKPLDISREMILDFYNNGGGQESQKIDLGIKGMDN